jgi:hypothetical protein
MLSTPLPHLPSFQPANAVHAPFAESKSREKPVAFSLSRKKTDELSKSIAKIISEHPVFLEENPLLRAPLL